MAHTPVGRAVPWKVEGHGFKPCWGQLAKTWAESWTSWENVRFCFFLFFCVLILSPLLGIIENAGVT